MNQMEIAACLDQLGIAFRAEVPPEALEMWGRHVSGVDPEVGLAAVDLCIAVESFFPTVAVFQGYVAQAIRERAKGEEMERVMHTGPSRSCPLCEGRRWYQVEDTVKANADGELETRYENWKPCMHCAPVEYARWEETRLEAAAMSRHRRGETTDGLASALAEARANLEGSP